MCLSKKHGTYIRRIYYWYPQKREIFFGTLSKWLFFPILRKQYLTFLYCSPFSYCSSNFASCFVFVLQIVSWLFFLYCFPNSYRTSNYCGSNSCRSIILLKTTIAITIVVRAITLGRAIKKRSKKLIPKIKQRIIIAITLQGPIEKSPIYNWIAT